MHNARQECERQHDCECAENPRHSSSLSRAKCRITYERQRNFSLVSRLSKVVERKQILLRYRRELDMFVKLIGPVRTLLCTVDGPHGQRTMYPRAFHYHRAGSLKEAAAMHVQLGEGAKLLAGGQSLIPLMKLRFANPAHLVDLNF